MIDNLNNNNIRNKRNDKKLRKNVIQCKIIRQSSKGIESKPKRYEKEYSLSIIC